MNTITPGDVVQLKSGGPRMTVSSYHWMIIDREFNKNYVQCHWFDTYTLTSGVFPILSLKRIE